MAEDQDKELHCSFCGKSQSEVKKLIAGKSIHLDNSHHTCINRTLQFRFLPKQRIKSLSC